VIDEAITKKCNLVVCFHPILFSGLKKITGKKCGTFYNQSYVTYLCCHTALDNHQNGVNKIFCDALGLKKPKS
jgi:putative NIF3 family GTP cyclohydrolase 1 type 2